MPSFLPPTLREKHRYILIEVKFEDKRKLEPLHLEFIKRKMLEFLGVLLYGKAGIQLISEEKLLDENKFIIRCNKDFLDVVLLSISQISEINGISMLISPLKMSGSLTKLKKEGSKSI